jgi:site-specific DNA-methyltransferase (adenine-specific)
MRRILLADCLAALPSLPAGCARLAYIDPPFNTGRVQQRKRIQVERDPHEGTRIGFGGRRYAARSIASSAFADRRPGDYLEFLLARIKAGVRCLSDDGSLFVHLDAREVHHVKVALDRVLGRERFMNEIIWAYDYGARSKTRWPSKHDTILWYALDPRDYVFRFDAMDRMPYMAPKLVTPEKAARGKTPTDVWWHTIVPTHGAEKTGYPTQKPLGILERIVKVHSAPGDVVLDFFAGSGTTGEAAAKNGRGFVLIDENPDAVRIMAQRLRAYGPECTGFRAVKAKGTGLDAAKAKAMRLDAVDVKSMRRDAVEAKRKRHGAVEANAARLDAVKATTTARDVAKAKANGRDSVEPTARRTRRGRTRSTSTRR